MATSTRYLIIGTPGAVSAKVAIPTIFDYLGPVELWDSREIGVDFMTVEGQGLDEWAESIWTELDLSAVVVDFSDIDSDYIVVGPSDEKYVAGAMSVGAKYLALDDGMVELSLEEEAEEVPVVPDVPEEIPVAEPVVQQKRPRGRPRKNPLPDQPELHEKTALHQMPRVAVQDRPRVSAGTGSRADILGSLISTLLADADEDTLWRVLKALKGF